MENSGNAAETEKEEVLQQLQDLVQDGLQPGDELYDRAREKVDTARRCRGNSSADSAHSPGSLSSCTIAPMANVKKSRSSKEFYTFFFTGQDSSKKSTNNRPIHSATCRLCHKSTRVNSTDSYVNFERHVQNKHAALEVIVIRLCNDHNAVRLIYWLSWILD